MYITHNTNIYNKTKYMLLFKRIIPTEREREKNEEIDFDAPVDRAFSASKWLI